MTDQTRPSDVDGSSTRIALLTSPAFLLALALLVLNDWVLKERYGTWWTGKLSDVAGLFAFAVFWAALLRRRRGRVFVLTALGFAMWKSPLSQPVLDAWNALDIVPLRRVVDYGDWLALLVLLPAYWFVTRSPTSACRSRSSNARRAGAVFGAIAAVLAFSATSIVPPAHPLPEHEGYLLSGSRSIVRAGLDSVAEVLDVTTARRRNLETTGPDTFRVHLRHPPERIVSVLAELSDATAGETRLRLLTVSTDGPEPSPEGIHRAFRAQIVEPLREWLARRTPPTARLP